MVKNLLYEYSCMWTNHLVFGGEYQGKNQNNKIELKKNITTDEGYYQNTMRLFTFILIQLYLLKICLFVINNVIK